MKLTASQEEVFRSFCAGANIFLTGKGGSGKSFLTRLIIDWCKERKKSVMICAPTGVAALNIGGSTIHRTFGIKVDEMGVIKPGERCRDKKKLGTIGRADVIIIDEISMCRADVFAYVANTLLHVFRTHKNDGKHRQLLVVGDFFQLPPVLKQSQQEAYNTLWGNILYAFQTNEWVSLNLQSMMLKESKRQSDKAFISALDNIREGKPDFEAFSDVRTDFNADFLTICGTNKQADSINKNNLTSLLKKGAKEKKLVSIDTGYPQPGDYPTEKELHLCVGAKVILLNNDPDKRWVNGSFATISGFTEDAIKVKLEGTKDEYEVKRNKWTICEYTVEPGNKGEEPKLVQIERATIEQYPVKLAWAISIHKSQGATYDQVNVDITNIFTTGQLYVALSRCRSLSGMRIIGKFTEEKAKVDSAVLKFMEGVGTAELTGPMFPFAIEEKEDPSEDRYQEGWDDGYDYRTKEVQEYYQELVDNDPSLKRLSPRVAREREKDLLPPEERNPKKAGRKPKPAAELKPTKAIRVPVALAETIKQIADLVKENPSMTDEVLQEFETFLFAHR